MQISIQEVEEVVHNDLLYILTLSKLKDRIREDYNKTYELTTLFPEGKTELTTGNMYSMLTTLKPYNSFKDMELSKEDFLTDYSNLKSYENLQDRIIKNFHATYENSHEFVGELMEDLTYIINELTIFGAKNILLEAGPTISIKDILDIGERNPEFKEVLAFNHRENTSHLDNLQDKIAAQDANKERTLDIIRKDNQSQFKTLLDSGGGVNPNQMTEVLNVVGYKPDIRGEVVPTPIDRSFFEGFERIQDFYTDALGARAALNTSKNQVRQSGYLNRKISILTEDVRIDLDLDDCGTQHYTPLKLTSKDMFKLVIDRWYLASDGEERLITEEDEWLIGKTVQLRSPITCAHAGDKICKKCYGDLYKVNRDLNVGTIANLIFTEPMTQKLLSTKHLLRVEVDVAWSETFFEYFNMEEDSISPVDPDQEIFISPSDLVQRETFTTNRYRTKQVYVKNPNGDKIFIDSPLYLIMADSHLDTINDLWDEGEGAYRLVLNEHFSEPGHMFKVVIRNIGIADPLMRMNHGLDRNTMIDVDSDHRFDKYFQRLMELLVQSDTYVMSIHIEVILSCMIRYRNRQVLLDPDIDLHAVDPTRDRTRRLAGQDVVVPGREHYQIYNINEAIYQSSSPVKALMYEQTIKQLKTDSFNNLFSKTAPSEFDTMFID